MADENETPADELTPDPIDGLAEKLTAHLAGQPVETPALEEGDEGANETQVGDEIPADEAGEGEGKKPDAEPEGPSFLMIQAARQAGLSELVISKMRDDAQIQDFIELMDSYRAPEGEEGTAGKAPAEATPLYAVTLPEEEYGADDPLRKEFSQIAEALTKRDQEAAKRETELREKVEKLEIERKGRLAREADVQVAAIQKPFDSALDSYQRSELGQMASLTPAQAKVRTAIGQKYVTLGATPDLPADELQRLAELAVAAYSKDLALHKQKLARAPRQQAGRVTGGNGAKPTEKPIPFKDNLGKFLRGEISVNGR